jgi:outer membrane protein assembly factor BamB
MNIYIASDDAIRKFDINGVIKWAYAPRGQLAAAPTLSTGCAPRLSATTVDDISAEEEELLRPDWVNGNGSDMEHSVQFFRDFRVGDLVKVKAGASYQVDGRELYAAGDQALISGVAPDDDGKYDVVLIEWKRTGRRSAVKFDTVKSHFVRVEPRISTTRCTPVLIGSTTSGYVFAIELATGYEVWAVQGTSSIAGVKGALASKNGVVVVATNRCTDRYCYRYRNQTNPLTPGNTVVRGLNVVSGSQVWAYVPQAPVWNMSPVWGPNGTVFFNDQEGRLYCLELATGVEVWQVGGELGTYTEAAAVYDGPPP